VNPEKIMASTLTFDVSQHGAFLATRSSARTIRESLETKATALDPGDSVTIDFTGVEAMTISFADEFLGKFYTALAAGDVPAQVVLLRGLNEDTHETVTVCLQRRELLAAAHRNSAVKLIAAPEFLVDTYRHAVALGTFRASELSDRLGITAQNANNRLRRLAEAGALHRKRAGVPERGGKEFIYTVPGATTNSVR
jgi:hypothetical protein